MQREPRPLPEIDSRVRHTALPEVEAYVLDIEERTSDGDVIVTIQYALAQSLYGKNARVHRVRWSSLEPVVRRISRK